MEIPGAPIDRVDCRTTQEYYIGHQGSICFDKIPAVEHTASLRSVIGKCRFCEHTIVVELHKRCWGVVNPSDLGVCANRAPRAATTL